MNSRQLQIGNGIDNFSIIYFPELQIGNFCLIEKKKKNYNSVTFPRPYAFWGQTLPQNWALPFFVFFQKSSLPQSLPLSDLLHMEREREREREKGSRTRGRHFWRGEQGLSAGFTVAKWQLFYFSGVWERNKHSFMQGAAFFVPQTSW